MSDRARHQRRRGWGRVGRARLLAAILILAVGVYAGVQAFAQAVRQRAPDIALQLTPGDARSLASKAELLTRDSPSPVRWAMAAEFARRALERDPMLPSAAATLGFRAGLNGDNETAASAFAYSQALSRRDLKTHLWAIEYAVQREDVPGALRHYDLALRTSGKAPAILFPVLASAIADAEIRRSLVPLLVKRTAWVTPFINFVAESPVDARATAALFSDLRRRGFVFPNGAEASLLGALVTSRDFATARTYLAAESSQVSSRSRLPRFSGNPAIPSPFDWNPQNDVGVMTSIQQGNQGGVFVFSTVAGTGGPILRQLQLLAPGQYEVVSRLVSIDPMEASLAWTIQCVDGGELARIPVIPRPEMPVRNGRFTVGPGCPAQWLILNVSPGELAGGVSGELDYAEIRPLETR